jgi:hypothetical protein
MSADEPSLRDIAFDEMERQGVAIKTLTGVIRMMTAKMGLGGAPIIMVVGFVMATLVHSVPEDEREMAKELLLKTFNLSLDQLALDEASKPADATTH